MISNRIIKSVICKVNPMTAKDVAHRACMTKMRNCLLFAPSLPILYFPFVWDLWWIK